MDGDGDGLLSLWLLAELEIADAKAQRAADEYRALMAIVAERRREYYIAIRWNPYGWLNKLPVRR
mgnify:CR=1 FL=1